MKRIKQSILAVKLFVEDYFAIEINGKKIPPPTAREMEIMKDLREDISARAKNQGGTTWRGFSLRLRNYIRCFDPRRFLRWHVIRQTMFMARAWPECIDALKADSEWGNIWQPVIKEDSFGDPIPDPTLPESSGNRIVHAYHLLQLKKSTDISFKDLDTIVEFGGGYGNMCRLLRRLGFKGTYILYDLPEFISLQKFYLNGVGEGAINAKDLKEAMSKQNVLVSSREELEKVLGSAKKQNSLFIATWSLSESPVAVREQVMPLVSDCTYYLFGYQPDFDEVNNVEYFRELSRQNEAIGWTEKFEKIWNGYYLFGKKK